MVFQWMLDIHKINWHLIHFLTLWVYQTSTKIVTIFTPFYLVYGLEVILPIECEILSLKLAVEFLLATPAEEECLLYL